MNKVVEIPPGQLAPEILQAIIEEFIAREGTDYGEQEVPLESKVSQVQRQIVRGDVLVAFDFITESCNLLTRHEFSKLQRQQAAEDATD